MSGGALPTLLGSGAAAGQAPSVAVDQLKGQAGTALFEAAGCSLLANVSDPAVRKVMEQKGLPNRGVVLLGPPSESSARPALYAVMRGLHTDGRVRLVPMSFVADLNSEWFSILSGGRREAPVMIVDGQVIGESIPIMKVLMTLFPDQAEAQFLGARGSAMIEEAQQAKVHVDALLKHFGFCRLPAGAKEYRHKGATSGTGLAWVKAHLAPVHELFSRYDGILKNSKFLAGPELSAVDCAACTSIGALHHVCAMPVGDKYPNCWRYYNAVKNLYVKRTDWPAVSGTGVGFFKSTEQGGMLVKVVNLERRYMTCCSDEGPEHLSNPVYWRGIDDTV